MQLLSRIAALPHQNYVLSLLQTSFSVSFVSSVWKECTKALQPTVGGVGGDFGETHGYGVEHFTRINFTS